MFRNHFPLLCLPLAALSPMVQAEVSEALHYAHYAVHAGAGKSLQQSISAASPVREHGRVFHGRTDWDIRWNYRWSVTPRGGCRITAVSTRLGAEVKLPQLDTATPEQRRHFDVYLEALRRHELGHVEIAREAAQRIDQAIAALPEMASCRALETAANSASERTLNEYRRRETDYDARTEHGRTQGAWLER